MRRSISWRASTAADSASLGRTRLASARDTSANTRAVDAGRGGRVGRADGWGDEAGPCTVAKLEVRCTHVGRAHTAAPAGAART